MKMLVLFVVLGLTGTAQAIKCYACASNRLLKAISLPEDLMEALNTNGLPSCDDFDANKEKYVQTCPSFHSGCMKVADPNDSSNVMRSCFVLGQDTCTGGVCYCNSDLCNSSGHAWPSVVLLLATLALTLAGGRW